MTTVARGPRAGRPSFDAEAFLSAFQQSSQRFHEQERATQAGNAFERALQGSENPVVQQLLQLEPRERAAILMQNPELFGQLTQAEFDQAMRAQEPPEPIRVREGETLVDPTTMQPLFQAPKQQQDTAPMRNAAALGLQPGTPDYDSYIRAVTMPAAAANVTVNLPGAPTIGSIPAGFEAWQDPESGAWQMRPVPGGPVAREEQAERERAAQRQANIALAGGTVVQDLGRGLTILEQETWAAGPVAAFNRNIPGTSAYLLQQFMNSAASNIGLDRLQAMRESSPTGGALGQVPFQQQQRLEQVLGSLDITQPPAVLADNIKRIINIYLDIVHGTPEQIQARVAAGEIGQVVADQLKERYELGFDAMGRPLRGGPVTPGGGDRAATIGGVPLVQSAEDYARLPSGAEYTAGDGMVRQKP